MTKSQFRLLILLTVLSGLVGGMLADLLSRGLPAAMAQPASASQIIKGQGFQLVDAAGEPRADLRLCADGSPALTLADAAGKLWAVVGCAMTVERNTGVERKYPESSFILFKANGEVLWQAP